MKAAFLAVAAAVTLLLAGCETQNQTQATAVGAATDPLTGLPANPSPPAKPASAKTV